MIFAICLRFAQPAALAAAKAQVASAVSWLTGVKRTNCLKATGYCQLTGSRCVL